MVAFQAKLAANDVVIKSVLKDSCAVLGLSILSLIQNFLMGSRSLCAILFSLGSLYAELHANNIIDGITLRFLGACGI